MCQANERRCYIVTTSLIGWVHTDPCTGECSSGRLERYSGLPRIYHYEKIPSMTAFEYCNPPLTWVRWFHCTGCQYHGMPTVFLVWFNIRLALLLQITASKEFLEMGTFEIIEKLHRIYTVSLLWWHHQMRYWPFVQGIHRWPVNSPHKSQWCRTLMFSLICAWTQGWVSNGDASDLRCHYAH